MKLGDVKKTSRRVPCACLLTLESIRQKSLFTHSIIERTSEEYDDLRVEIETLAGEAGLAIEATPAPRRTNQ